MKKKKFVFYFDHFFKDKRNHSVFPFDINKNNINLIRPAPNALPSHFYSDKGPKFKLKWYMDRGWQIHTSLLRLSDYVGLDYKIKKTGDSVNEDYYNWYVIDITGCPDYALTRPYIHTLKNIPWETLLWIDENDINIMIWYAEESQSKYLVTSAILPEIDSIVDEIVSLYPLDKSRLFFCIGNLGITKIVLDSTPQYDWNISDIGIFDVLYHSVCKDISKDSPIYSVKATNKTKNKERNKYFNSLNGALKPHRLYWVAEAYRRKLNTKGYISLLGRYDVLDRGNDRQSTILEYPYAVTSYCDTKIHQDYILVPHIRSILNRVPIILDIDVDTLNTAYNDWGSPQEYIQDSYFSVVTEANNTSQGKTRSLFVTEKSYKSFLNLQPFIILGDKHILKYLQGQGYETFPEFFDESYDEIDDNTERLFFCIEQIEILCKKPLEEVRGLYQSVWPKLVSNREKFLNYNFKKKIEDVLTKRIFYNRGFED